MYNVHLKYQNYISQVSITYIIRLISRRLLIIYVPIKYLGSASSDKNILIKITIIPIIHEEIIFY